MKRYPLNHGRQTLVDDDIFDRLVELRRRWRAVKRRRTYYAIATIDGLDTYMHRWILGAPKGRHVDHINGEGLDNQRKNIRLVTPTQNSLNRQQPTQSASGFRGVRRVSDESSWAAYANVSNRQEHLGCFETAEAAAVMRDDYMRRNHSTARLNFEKRGDAPMTLREARRQKLKAPKPKTGHPNIRLKNGAYETSVRMDGKRVYIGRFPSLDEALEAQVGSVS